MAFSTLSGWLPASQKVAPVYVLISYLFPSLNFIEGRQSDR
jgi:hypothetical protein